MVAITLTKTCLRHDGHRYGIGETVDVPDNLAASLIAEGLAIAAPTPTGEDGGGSTVSPSPPAKKPAKPAEAG
ncbi:hypothetical protein P7L75_01245 (plasmid) [Tistrella mobilis]|uniref:hypothetical protein n=1 Tax=Tistrella mobilis TaxID=171437 RepID=UPI00355774AD